MPAVTPGRVDFQKVRQKKAKKKAMRRFYERMNVDAEISTHLSWILSARESFSRVISAVKIRKKMASAYGTIARQSSGRGLDGIVPFEAKLKDCTSARVVHISAEERHGAIFAPGSPKLVRRMHHLFNAEIEDGNTYPQEEVLDETQFRAYFLSYDAFVVLRTSGKESSFDDDRVHWETELLGFFYVKPNFPGRCSHICNGGFFTVPVARNLGVGHLMAKAFLVVVPFLGYKASMFNLVFENNVASVKLWQSLNFREIGRIPKAGRLRSSTELVDAIMFYYDFTEGLTKDDGLPH